MTTIRINNAKFFSFHGVFEYEKKYGNEFGVDVEMECDLSLLKDSDDIKLTVDYSEVYKLTEKVFTEKKYNLIETVNEVICREILNVFPSVKSVKVSTKKSNAPLGIIDSVEVITKMKRD
ncbi:MAG: dihydroneopterin aldolase [Ignavibacteria bacterium]